MLEVNRNFFHGAIVMITRRMAGTAFFHRVNLQSPKSLAVTGLCRLVRPHRVPLLRAAARSPPRPHAPLPSGLRRWCGLEPQPLQKVTTGRPSDIYQSWGRPSEKSIGRRIRVSVALRPSGLRYMH